MLFLALFAMQALFLAFTIRTYINPLSYGKITKWIGLAFAIIQILISWVFITGLISMTHYCALVEDDSSPMFCLQISVFGIPILGGPGMLGFGYIFLWIERSIMGKKYGKSTYVLRPELHPAIVNMIP